MKRILFILVFVVGIISLASCRSTSDPCGLADNSTIKVNNLNLEVIV